MIGDKFASRSGQKGIVSRLWADVDMPFCAATGMRPDLIINPHAFPSRMTIGMLIESLTSKSGALQGSFVDASPFQECDDPNAEKLEIFADQLEKAGFNRQGTETMICGITGEEMECDIYIGLVYYQRLMHMVSDKFQCRAVGPINAMTKQPVKGRKFGGGIRFGEMERDSAAAHGAAYTISDRMMKSSDSCQMSICRNCHSMITVGNQICPICGGPAELIESITVPYSLSLLATELAAVNISMKFFV